MEVVSTGGLRVHRKEATDQPQGLTELPRGADSWGIKRIGVEGERRRTKALQACVKAEHILGPTTICTGKAGVVTCLSILFVKNWMSIFSTLSL